MEQLDKANEKELLLRRAKATLKQLKEEAVIAKNKGEHFNGDAINFDPDSLNLYEAELLEKLHSLKKPEECEIFGKELKKFSEIAHQEFEEKIKASGEQSRPITAADSPKIAFASYIGAEFTAIRIKIEMENKR